MAFPSRTALKHKASINDLSVFSWTGPVRPPGIASRLEIIADLSPVMAFMALSNSAPFSARARLVSVPDSAAVWREMPINPRSGGSRSLSIWKNSLARDL